MADRLKTFLRSYNFNVETHSTLRNARQYAKNEKLDGVFIFWSSECEAFVHELRASGLNRSSMICAIIAEKTAAGGGFRPGCNFTFDLPTLANNLQRYMKAMFGLVVKEHRRYFRSPTPIEVDVVSPSVMGSSVQCVDISTTGIGLHLSVSSFRLNDKVTLAIDLCDGHPYARVDAQVRWMEPDGRVGLRFLDTPLEVLERLQEWLERTIAAAERSLQSMAYQLP